MIKTRRKIEKRFSFPHPLYNKRVSNLRIVRDLAGVVMVEGTAYCYPNTPVTDADRFGYDIDFVLYNGMDIKAVLESVNGMDLIQDATAQNIAGLFTGEEIPVEDTRQESDKVPVIRLVESLNAIINQTTASR